MEVTHKALAAVRSLVGLQVLAKLLNFLLNVAIARVVAPEVYGTANVTFVLVNNIVLHFSRETFRKAVLKGQQVSYTLM